MQGTDRQLGITTNPARDIPEHWRRPGSSRRLRKRESDGQLPAVLVRDVRMPAGIAVALRHLRCPPRSPRPTPSGTRAASSAERSTVTVWRARPGGRQVQGHTIGSNVDTPAEGVGVTGQRSNQRVWLNLVATQRETDLEAP